MTKIHVTSIMLHVADIPTPGLLFGTWYIYGLWLMAHALGALRAVPTNHK